MVKTIRAITLILMASIPGFLRAEIIEDLPDAVVCSVKDPTGFLPWEELVFYVSAHTRDGNTLYKTLTSNPVVLIIEKNGIINAPNLTNCDGLHIDALLDAGRAFHLTRPTQGN